MNNFVDYYKILGVNENASLDEIKKSFHTLAKKYHPDSCINSTKEEQLLYKKQLQEVLEAYEVLKDDNKRSEYNVLYHKYKEKQIKNKAAKTYKSYLKKVKNNIKKSYQEVKKEEEKYPFLKRHSIYDSRLNKNYSNKKEQIFLYIKRGTFHVCAETFYQLSKLSYFSEDSIPKFVLRNRKIVAMSLIIPFLLNTNNANNIDTKSTYTSSIEYNNKKPTSIKLTRNYKVLPGDNYTYLQEQSNTPIHIIKSINNKCTDKLLIGESLFLPYNIPIDDMPYYTYPVEYNYNITLEEFAKIHATSIEDLITLNPDSIIKSNDSYLILTTSLYVPNFITKEELQIEKTNNEKMIAKKIK